ncbi:MAG: PHP domain-containing protein, partial [Gemmatimonadetes bacterium]|nr:PHP domain-containing protein [Gemmatimonadota bacterium]
MSSKRSSRHPANGPKPVPRYAELQVTSNFSFLRGASHPAEMVERAGELGYQALALTDRNTLAGVVRAYEAARRTGLHFIPGARLDLADGPSLLCLPTTRHGYGALSRLITTGRRRAPKGECMLTRDDVAAAADPDGHLFIVLPPVTFGTPSTP